MRVTLDNNKLHLWTCWMVEYMNGIHLCLVSKTTYATQISQHIRYYSLGTFDNSGPFLRIRIRTSTLYSRHHPSIPEVMSTESFRSSIG